MDLFYKWLITLLCAVVLNCFVVLKTTHVSAQVELDQLSCPTMMMIGVLKSDHNLVEFLLEYGADSNASLENCQIVVNDDEVIVLLKENQKLVDTWVDSRIGLLLNNIPDNSSLLHIAARLRPKSSNKGILGDMHSAQVQIYNLLVRYEANTNAMDATGRTPESIFRMIKPPKYNPAWDL